MNSMKCFSFTSFKIFFIQLIQECWMEFPLFWVVSTAKEKKTKNSVLNYAQRMKFIQCIHKLSTTAIYRQHFTNYRGLKPNVLNVIPNRFLTFAYVNEHVKNKPDHLENDEQIFSSNINGINNGQRAEETIKWSRTEISYAR